MEKKNNFFAFAHYVAPGCKVVKLKLRSNVLAGSAVRGGSGLAGGQGFAPSYSDDDDEL